MTEGKRQRREKRLEGRGKDLGARRGVQLLLGSRGLCVRVRARKDGDGERSLLARGDGQDERDGGRGGEKQEPAGQSPIFPLPSYVMPESHS